MQDLKIKFQAQSGFRYRNCAITHGNVLEFLR